MLLAYEGVDGAGKTTAAERLAAHLLTDVRHHGPPQRHPLEEYVLDLDGYVPGAGAHVVVDRLHLGELIYAPIYRGESKLGPVDGAGHRYVDLYLASRGGVLVHVDAPLGTIRSRLAERGEDFLQRRHVETVHRAYRDVAPVSASRVRTVTYRATGPGAAAFDAKAVELAVRLEAEAATTYAATGGRYLGQPRPRVLLVGEETSPRHLRGLRPVFAAPFVPYKDSSGWHLFNVLPSRVVNSVAVVNAREVALEATHAAMGYPAVVALGRTAGDELTRAGIAHAQVPHPQYVRRFHHDRLDEYGALVAEIAGTTEKEPTWPS